MIGTSRHMNDRTKSLLADTRNLAREQVAAAWQLHIDRVQEALIERGPEEIEQIFEERLAGLANCLEEQHRNALELRLQEASSLEEQQRNALQARLAEAAAESRAAAERDLARKLNQAVRCLRGSENGDWSTELVQATQGFCDRAAVFTLQDGSLHLEAARGAVPAKTLDDVPLETAPAFANAVESRDTVIAMRTKGELSPRIASWTGEESGRSYIFPVASRGHVLGLLYADADHRAVESSALELLAMAAGAFAGEHAAAAQKPVELVSVAPTGQKPVTVAWTSLTREQQDLHHRAQRFSRVQVAEIRLYKSENVKKGRAGRCLYASLKTEIDAAREAYRNDYLSASDTMVDYLHPELVRTLANDDAELLGPDYPGPLV
jgi:hypothetical protein